jgi:formiminotetrahydrofolate cyclodeaminase
MLTQLTLQQFLQELSSKSPAPGGGSVAAFSGAIGAALGAMVCNLTIGKKKYAEVEEELQRLLPQAESLTEHFTRLVDLDTEAFQKVMEAFTLPKENENQKALRTTAIQQATKEAALVPLRVMRLCIDGLAIVKTVAQKGNGNSVSDAGVGALMLRASAEGAALNVRINLGGITDQDFVDWQSNEVSSLLRTIQHMSQETLDIVEGRIAKP